MTAEKIADAVQGSSDPTDADRLCSSPRGDGRLHIRRYLAAILSLHSSIAVISAVLFIFSGVLDVRVDLSDAGNIFTIPPGDFRPEPMEKLLFATGLLLMPFSLLFTYRLFSLGLSRVKHGGLINLAYRSAFLISIALIALLVFVDLFEDGFYFLQRSVLLEPWGFVLVCALTAAWFYLAAPAEGIAKRRLASKIFYFAMRLLAVFSLLSAVLYNVFTKYSVAQGDDIFELHFNNLFHAAVQVFFGKELLVDFTHQYGLYPHFLDPLFKVFGLSVFSFTVVMAALMALSLYSIYRFLVESSSDMAVGLAGFVAVVYYGYVFNRLLSPDPYFQYHPVRFFFPAISIYLTYKYASKESITIYYLSFVLYSIAVLWNFDTGFVVFASWVLFLVYGELFHLKAERVAGHLLKGSLVFIAVICAYTLCMYTMYGKVPDYLSFMRYQNVFYNYGYAMQPMRLLHPWNLIALVYAGALLYSSMAVVERRESSRAKMFFFLAVLGAGLFTYYQGRSLNGNLTSVSYPALILVALFADAFLKRVRGSGAFLDKVVIVFLLFFLSTTALNFLDGARGFHASTLRRLDQAVKAEDTPILRNAFFISSYTQPGEKVLILSDNSGIYYLESGTVSPLRVPLELFFIEDCRTITDYLGSSLAKKVFFDNIKGQRDPYYPIGMASFEGYRIHDVSRDGNIVLFVKE